ncbi:hypothetical protein DL96DRAFT_1573824 [Flagelloscypha sp. PMI_526]|nr:hypothetical protein DL96DRAFT_1573824 [Flagelloscypha sp. PMI_526]
MASILNDIDNGTMLKSKDCGNQSPSACLSMSGILNGVQTSNFCVQDLRENLAAELPVVTVSYMSLLVKPEVVQHYLARLQHGTFFISQEVLALASITLSSLRYGPRFDEIKFLTLRQGLFSIVESLSGDSLSKLHPICSAANPGDIIANAELLLGQKYGTMKAYEWSQPGNGLLNALLEDLRDEVISRWGRSSFVLLTVPDIDPMSGLTLKNIEERYIDQTRPIIQP